MEDNDPIDEHGAERDAPFDVHLAAERATEQVHGPLAGHAPPPDLQSAPRDSRVCSPLTNCHAPNARRLSEVIIAGQNRRHGRRSRSGSRTRCGSPARRLRESQQMDSAFRGGCRLAARQTVRSSLFSPPPWPRRRGEAGSMASCSTPAKQLDFVQYRQSGLRGQQSLSQLSLTNLSAVSSGATPAGFEADFARIISAIFCNVTRCYAPPKP